MDCLSALLFTILFSLLLQGGIAMSIVSAGVAMDSNNLVFICVEKTGAEMATDCFYPLNDSYLSLNLKDSPGNSNPVESVFAEPDKYLVLPNISRNEVLEEMVFEHEASWERRRGIRRRGTMRRGIMEKGRQRRKKAHHSDRFVGYKHGFNSGQLSMSRIEVQQLKIGLLVRSVFKNSMEASLGQKQITGFALDVFEAAVEPQSYKRSYKIVTFNGSYDALLKEVALKTFDAAVGDIVIRSEGYQLVDFSQPYADAALVMVVTTKTNKSLSWLFMSTFSRGMWFMIAAMILFTGFVVWFIECPNHSENGDSLARQIETVLSYLFTTLYYGQREVPNSRLFRFVLVPWSLLMLIVASTFIASLTSMLTNSHFEPSTVDVNMLRMTDAAVGCDGSSFIIQYLVKALGFKPKNIRSIASIDDYAEALQSGNVKAAFILKPYAKVFLAKYCKGFTIAEPNYELGGFGFVFQKGSALASDISQAILRLKESGKLQLIEEKMLSSIACSTSHSDDNVSQSLGPEPFLAFFIISGGASAIALLIKIIHRLRRHWERMADIQAALMGRGLWMWLTTLFTQNQTRNELQLARKSYIPETEG